MELRDILAKLISFPSITPDDAGCQTWMMDYFRSLGFHCQQYDNPPVSNFFAYLGENGPLLVFAGHSDVVSVGDHHKWHTDPFDLTEVGGKLYGRGVADMKGSIAAMLLMAKWYAEHQQQFKGRLGFLITSGEEGDLFEHGTPHVMSELTNKGVSIDYCVVGEPSSSKTVGDVIKIGRRGSLTGKLTLHGKQGHVAYPHLALNPIHQIAPALAQFCQYQWDAGNDFFPPTTLQITHIDSGGHASNIIPGELQMQFNFRFSTEQTAIGLQQQTEAIFHQHTVPVTIEWRVNGEPFLTKRGPLIEATVKAIQAKTNRKPELSTSGGTSDGRFIAPYGVEVVELGPVNASIHQVNEWCDLSELECLATMYYQICLELLS
ncbi:succinyl-diaminopimelate desuccinylase [Legionella sp. W05-934-2]|jgi:succinyl-diaminopimelate desuccinylase|uniref:succinyl-diaminopimelate desuccinylase n=1 Tax=Legionella sp. W05-934-2 TaxID=1198649 RepID=UPI0034623980